MPFPGYEYTLYGIFIYPVLLANISFWLPAEYTLYDVSIYSALLANGFSHGLLIRTKLCLCKIDTDLHDRHSKVIRMKT